MTTDITVKVHCSKDKKVMMKIESAESIEVISLEDGESIEQCIYDDREISVKEVLREG